IASSRASASEDHHRTPDPPTARLNRRPLSAAANTPRGGGRLPLRPKRAALQTAQASAPDALLPDNPRSRICSSGLLLLRRTGLVFRALDIKLQLHDAHGVGWLAVI